MKSLRVLVHALDRTGPPVLASTFVSWLTEMHPELSVDVVAFRGGPLLDDVLDHVPVTVVLDPHEPWAHDSPEPRRMNELRDRLADLPPADVTLLVSVAASPCLAFVPPSPSTVTWVVEQGEDLHWVKPDALMVERTTHWLASTDAVEGELLDRLGSVVPVGRVPEFVGEPAANNKVTTGRRRASVGAGDGTLLVMGAGIGTHRKAPDLFVEVALHHSRYATGDTCFVWTGGEHDELFHQVQAETRRVGLSDRIRFVGNVEDVVPWFRAADVLLHPARIDAFPLVCLHAAAVGTPVVAFAGTGTETMFGTAFCGAPYPDVPALADAVEELRDPSVRQARGNAQTAATITSHSVAGAGPLLLEYLRAIP